jgi:hypothetical protein
VVMCDKHQTAPAKPAKWWCGGPRGGDSELLNRTHNFIKMNRSRTLIQIEISSDVAEIFAIYCSFGLNEVHQQNSQRYLSYIQQA